MSVDKKISKSLKLHPDDFEIGDFVTTFKQERSSGVAAEVLAIDFPFLLLSPIRPGGEQPWPHVADLRFDTFRRLSDEYVQAIVDFSIPNLNATINQLEQSNQDLSNCQELEFDLVLLELGPHLLEVASRLSKCFGVDLARILETLLNHSKEGTVFSSISACHAIKLKCELEAVGAELFFHFTKGDSNNES